MSYFPPISKKVRSALGLYERHKKISMSRITTKPMPGIQEEQQQQPPIAK